MCIRENFPRIHCVHVQLYLYGQISAVRTIYARNELTDHILWMYSAHHPHLNNRFIEHTCIYTPVFLFNHGNVYLAMYECNMCVQLHVYVHRTGKIRVNLLTPLYDIQYVDLINYYTQ